MKKITSVIAIMLFVTGLIPVSARGEGSSDTSEWIFQKMSDNISQFGKGEPGEKGSLTKVFQRSRDHIVETAPKAKETSMRGQKDALKTRLKEPVEREGVIELEKR
ncbi:MAG: hypothetical protein ABID09_01475 [Candidatus Omnitrophota bacterium]